MKTHLNLKVGEWIEVRSKEEILRTLDKKGQIDGLPFMPEMFAYCGQRFQVYKRAHKTCDTVFPIRGRGMHDTVHLETRCSGQAHGGCQANCLLFWKEAWLKRVDAQNGVNNVSNGKTGADCTEEDVLAGTVAAPKEGDETPTYICQNTQIPYATTDLPWWNFRQYVEDLTSGNVSLWEILRGAFYSTYFHISNAGIGLGRIMRWGYNAFRGLRNGNLWPRATGSIPLGMRTPTGTLDLQPGELVRTKSHAEILETLNVANQNRGMGWDAELVPYCNRTYRVLKRVDKIIDEKTGKMIQMKNPCIILDGVVCKALYSQCRMFCPRAFPSYWREIWLERVSESKANNGVERGKVETTEVTERELEPSGGVHSKG